MADAQSTATATWRGSTVSGAGAVSTASASLLDRELTWRGRIGEQAGATPEELLAAAHAGCLAMALSFALTMAGHEPERLDVRATCSFGPEEGGYGIHGMHLAVEADVPGIAEQEFRKIALGAKEGCPVTRALAGIEVTLEAVLRTQ